MITTTPKKIAITIAGIVLIWILFWSIRTGPLWVRGSSATMPIPSITEGSATSSGKAKIIVSPGVDIDYGYATGTSKTPQKGGKLSASAPSLDRPIVIPASFSPADASLAKESIVKLIDAIKKSPENGALWADLGLKRKGIEDYVGAKEAYEYALKLMPGSAMVADSLGVIYGDYLKDYPKAEQQFRLAITLDPTASYLYIRLFEFYQYSLKDMAKARAILKEGLQAIPGDTSFMALLEALN